MSEDVKPRIFHTTMLIGSNDESWISSKNKDFIDKIFYKEKFKSIELEPTLQLMKEMGEIISMHHQWHLDFTEVPKEFIGLNMAAEYCDASMYDETKEVLEKYRKFLEGIEK